MARKYQIVFGDTVPQETRDKFAELGGFIEAGPGTIQDKLSAISVQLGSGYDVSEDDDDYIVHVDVRGEVPEPA